MKKLLQGIIEFRKRFIHNYRKKFSKLAWIGQSPDLLLVSCCDSRVAPNVFASTNPGDVFALRNIGNLIPPYCPSHTEDLSAVAAVDYSLLTLKVSDIIICGHSECGAMCTFFQNTPNPIESSALKHWLSYADSSYKKFCQLPESERTRSQLAPHNLLSQINVVQQLENLKSYPEVRARLSTHQLRIHGWYFDLATGNISYYNENKQSFTLLDEKEAERLLLKGLST